jgi:hypothetical protein
VNAIYVVAAVPMRDCVTSISIGARIADRDATAIHAPADCRDGARSLAEILARGSGAVVDITFCDSGGECRFCAQPAPSSQLQAN